MLIHLEEAIQLKCTKMWAAKNWVFLHENAPVYEALLAQQQLSKHGSGTSPPNIISQCGTMGSVPLFPRPTEGLLIQGCSGDSNGFKGWVAGGYVVASINNLNKYMNKGKSM